MKILILAPAPPDISPGQRFRFEHYLQLPEAKKMNFVSRFFFSLKGWKSLHKNGHLFKKMADIILGFLKRFFVLFSVYKYDFVYVYREAAPIGPPVFEWIIARVLRKKIIYDFDDAIWISVASDANPGAAKLKCSWKVAKICRYSFIVTVGNEYLAAFARQYCRDVRIIPTVVDTEKKHNRIKDQREGALTIGWTGTFSTLPYLNLVKKPLQKIIEKYKLSFLVIGNKDPAFTEFPYTFKEWNAETEAEDLLKMNIGIMPLANTPFELGKCGFKAIQYMSLGIPAVVSPVGVNTEVVQNNINGLWANSDEQWFDAMEALLEDEQLRVNMGTKGRAHIEANYSVNATSDLFFNLFSR